MIDVGVRYLEHLSEGDLALLGPVAGVEPDDAVRHFRGRPHLVETALGDPRVFDRLLGQGQPDEVLVHTSPFLVFAVVVRHALDGLRRASFVEERVGRHVRVPVFDTGDLADFGADPVRRLFVAEHLASYTRVASGPVWVQRRGRWRRHRFSEVDPARLAATLDVVGDRERPGIYRRLGDLALLLTGVFPDHSAAAPVRPIDLERVLRSLPPERRRPRFDQIAGLAGDHGWDGLLDWFGPRWYGMAASATPVPGVAAELHDIASRFEPARRFLNVVTDRYLFPLRGQLFPRPGS